MSYCMHRKSETEAYGGQFLQMCVFDEWHIFFYKGCLPIVLLVNFYLVSCTHRF